MSEFVPQIGRALVAILLGVGGSLAYFLLIDWLIRRLPPQYPAKLRPWAYLAPALLLLLAYLIYPVINTTYLSFFGPRSETFVGLANYNFAFTNDEMLIAFRNNVIWLIVAVGGTVGFGLLIAVLAERVLYERVTKTLIFLPMAVSFVGAGVIWKYIYAFRPEGRPQIGLLNAVVTSILKWEPVAWLIQAPENNLFLIFVFVWIWTGFAVVVLSAALKGLPDEILDAARVDGANEWQVFWQVMVPMIRSTIAVVATTMIIYVLKIFDIVYVMTNGNRDTEVIANRMYKEMFQFRHFGRASAIAFILLVAIIPVMLFNIRRFQEQEEQR